MKGDSFKWLIFFSMALNLFTQTLGQTSSTTDASGNVEIYQGLVLGVGKGTIAVCVFGIFGLIICFFKDCTATPSLMIFVGILIPVLVFVIILGIPKESLRTDT